MCYTVLLLHCAGVGLFRMGGWAMEDHYFCIAITTISMLFALGSFSIAGFCCRIETGSFTRNRAFAPPRCFRFSPDSIIRLGGSGSAKIPDRVGTSETIAQHILKHLLSTQSIFLLPWCLAYLLYFSKRTYKGFNLGFWRAKRSLGSLS